MSSDTPPEHEDAAVPRHTLDPELAAAAAGGAPAESPTERHPTPAIDTRPYRWTIGVFGLVLVIAGSVYGFVKLGVHAPGVAAGERIPHFVAPLASGTLNGDANLKPRCDPAHPLAQALNVCGRTPLVLVFFVTGSGTCKRQVDTLQAVSRQFAPGAAQFAAVAVHAGHSETAKLVAAHHWTIPVAYDRDGQLGNLYGVEICPMIELARRGGMVTQRLIGSHWLATSSLHARVEALLAR